MTYAYAALSVQYASRFAGHAVQLLGNLSAAHGAAACDREEAGHHRKPW